MAPFFLPTYEVLLNGTTWLGSLFGNCLFPGFAGGADMLAMEQPHWGLKDDRDVEVWAHGIRLLSQWYYFDKPEPRLGAFQLMRYFPFLARMARIVHYRLGKPAR